MIVTIDWQTGTLRFVATTVLLTADQKRTLAGEGFSWSSKEGTHRADYTPARHAFLEREFGITDLVNDLEHSEQVRGEYAANLVDAAERDPFLPAVEGEDADAYWQRQARNALARAVRFDPPLIVYNRLRQVEDRLTAVQGDESAAGQRLTWFLQGRLAFETALYALVEDGIPADHLTLEVGGAVLVEGFWYRISHVGPSAVKAVGWGGSERMEERVARFRIRNALTRAEWEATDTRMTIQGWARIHG